MKNGSPALFAALFLLTAASASAEQDFYGIQMKNERWAKNLVWNAAPAADPADLLEGPVLSHDVTAEASLKEITDGRIDFRVTIFNGTPVTISTDYHFRDFYITARDGRKYPLIDNQTQLDLNTIEPKKNVTFNPSFGNLRLKNKDVMLIECSFDLGKTKVFLFPWTQKDAVAKLSNPPLPEVPTERGRGAQEISRPKERSSKRSFWERLSGTNKAARKGVSPESSKAPSASESASVNSGEAAQTPAPAPAVPQSANRRLDDAIKSFVYVPADAAGQKTSGAAQTNTVVSSSKTGLRTEAHVISFDKTYGFVTLNLGSRDGLRNDMVLSVLRNGKAVAKVRVKEIRAAVSAATLIPESVKAEIKSGDQVSLV